jgi:hypothetical protein
MGLLNSFGSPTPHQPIGAKHKGKATEEVKATLHQHSVRFHPHDLTGEVHDLPVTEAQTTELVDAVAGLSDGQNQERDAKQLQANPQQILAIHRTLLP